MALRILLATTCRWFSTARLAMAFAQRGSEVDLVGPYDHPADSTHVLVHRYPYSGLFPYSSFRRAILASQPALVVPCDDLAMHYLHHVYDQAVSQPAHSASQRTRQILEFSLGDPAGYAITGSRDRFMATIHQLGIRAPETQTVSSVHQMEEWLARFGFPAVLKADGTSGGEGVKIVQDLPQAIRAFHALHAPLPTLVAAKRTILDHDPNCILPWLRQRPREVSIQSFIPGPDANVALACWQGEVLASIGAQVLETWRPKGPATIVRLTHHQEISEVVRKIVRRLGFSGFCGFDFMLDPQSGSAYLIEMNARATQTCPLSLGPGRDPVSALCSALTGQPVTAPPLSLSGNTLALFPLAWQGDTSSTLFRSSYPDFPVGEPDLVCLGFAENARPSHDKWIRILSMLRLHRP